MPYKKKTLRVISELVNLFTKEELEEFCIDSPSGSKISLEERLIDLYGEKYCLALNAPKILRESIYIYRIKKKLVSSELEFVSLKNSLLRQVGTLFVDHKPKNKVSKWLDDNPAISKGIFSVLGAILAAAIGCLIGKIF